MTPICFTVLSKVFSISTTGSVAIFSSWLTVVIKSALSRNWFSISVMELLISSLKAAMVLMESLTCKTCFLFSSFNPHTFPIFSVMASRLLMVPFALLALCWEAPLISSTNSLILAVIFWVSTANSRISFATTANPFPASPARAASIAALSASRFVCNDMVSIPAITSFMRSITSSRLSMSFCIWREPMIVSSESSLMLVKSLWEVSILL